MKKPTKPIWRKSNARSIESACHVPCTLVTSRHEASITDKSSFDNSSFQKRAGMFKRVMKVEKSVKNADAGGLVSAGTEGISTTHTVFSIMFQLIDLTFKAFRRL